MMRGGTGLRQNERMNPTRAWLLLVLCLLAGCAGERKSQNLLQVALYDYAGAIRFSDFNGAATFLDPQVLAQDPLTELELQRLQQVQITGYRVLGSEQPAPDEARQVVEIRLINKHTQVERNLIDRQRWRFDAEQKRWWLVSGLPDITQGQ